jgi:Flp pilus assembly pilin Flp
MGDFLRNLWWQEEGQDIAEYAVMLAVILVLVVGTIRLIGTSAWAINSELGPHCSGAMGNSRCLIQIVDPSTRGGGWLRSSVGS